MIYFVHMKLAYNHLSMQGSILINNIIGLEDDPGYGTFVNAKCLRNHFALFHKAANNNMGLRDDLDEIQLAPSSGPRLLISSSKLLS